MKLLLFDLDWTLIYTGGAGVRALNDAFEKKFGIQEAMKTVSPDGKTDPQIVREMIGVNLHREATDAEVQEICRGYLDRLAHEVNGSGYRVLPGIAELLEALSRRSDILLGLGTGNFGEGARIKLSRADLFKYFRCGGYADDSEDRPQVLRAAVRKAEAMAQTNFAPRDVYVIGDNGRDVEAGKAIGATTVAVATGPMSYENLQAAQPDYLFRDLSNTAEILGILAPSPRPRPPLTGWG